MAATEFAVSMPLIVILLLGTLDATSMIFLQQSLQTAAYEGARVAVGPGVTEKDVRSVCAGILEERRVASAVVNVSPDSLETTSAGTWVTVTISAPGNTNSVVDGLISSFQTIQAQVSMMKEY